MFFSVDGQCHVLKGLFSTHSPTENHDLFALLASVQLNPTNQLLSTPKVLSTDPITLVVQTLMSTFHDIFDPPTGLPPSRPIDHRIPLLPNSNPVNVCLYCYPHSQKAELENQMKDILANGLIQPSSSPYSSSVLLDKKKEGTWRFWVDYHALNAITIKDHFLIPVVDEILNELHGATYFSKLDLHAGYHQIRMHPEDIPKTAFQTHNAHFEFVVMSFGLTNTPSTFQSLMNHVFKTMLRKNILVFFNDILMYSLDLDSHLIHLEAVFSTLRANQLKVKLSKCSFAQPKVDYLGHVIFGPECFR